MESFCRELGIEYVKHCKEVTCTDRDRDTESALFLSLLSWSRGTVTESVTLHWTVLGSSLPTHSLGVGRNVSPGQRGAGGGHSNAACRSAVTWLQTRRGNRKPLYNVSQLHSGMWACLSWFPHWSLTLIPLNTFLMSTATTYVLESHTGSFSSHHSRSRAPVSS